MRPERWWDRIDWTAEDPYADVAADVDVNVPELRDDEKRAEWQGFLDRVIVRQPQDTPPGPDEAEWAQIMTDADRGYFDTDDEGGWDDAA